MGACLSYDEDEKRSRAHSYSIDKQLYRYNHQEANAIRILLLGAGESGKSTLVKQMKIIHSDGFTAQELDSFKPAVLENLLSSMKFVLSGMGLLRINLDDPQNKKHAQIVLSCQRCYDQSYSMLPVVSSALMALWNDNGVRRAVARGYDYELNDSAIYYFENMDRICSEKYRPNQIDVLRARVRTAGVIETCFKFCDIPIRLFDVGGQRGERRKWIHCFDNVKTLLFVTAISGYDMTLREDPNVNRLDESLRLFEQIVNIPFFVNSSLILFLNKLDLFEDKILYSNHHLKYYFHAFTGPVRDVESAALFIQDIFTKLTPKRNRINYTHFTTATDTTNVKVVFKAVMDTIIKGSLEACQLL